MKKWFPRGPRPGALFSASEILGLGLGSDSLKFEIIEGPTHFCFHPNHPASLPLISKLSCPEALFVFILPSREP